MQGYINLNPDNRCINITFDEPQVSEINNSGWYTGKLKKCQTINMKNMSDFPHMHCDRWSGMDGFDMINLAHQYGFKYAIVWADGAWPTDSDFDESIIDAIEEYNKTSWICAGHILNRAGDFPVFHQQCVLINLDNWKAANRPDFEQYKLKFFPAYTPSEENLHDDYTPMYLDVDSSEKGERLHSPYRGNFLDPLIPHSLFNQYRVYNLPYSVRTNKISVYPEDDVNETAGWLLDDELHTDFSNSKEIIQHKTTLPEDKRHLFSLKVLNNTIVYITNTESLPTTWDKKINTLVCPCSGLFQFEHIIGNIDTMKRVVWCDFSPYGVAWTKHLLKNWDGIDFFKFLQENKHILYDMGFTDNDTLLFDEKNAETFFNERTQQEWLEMWDRIRELQHEFLQLDIVREWPRVVEAVGKNSIVHCQLSNIWQYEINYLNNSGFTAQTNFVLLMNELLKNNRDVYFSGDTPGGMFYEYANLKHLPGIL